jgi:hypothetical protein
MSIKIGEAVKGGIIPGIFCAVGAGLMNYYVIQFPKTLFDNGINHAITGLISAFCAGFFGLIVFMVRQSKSQKR